MEMEVTVKSETPHSTETVFIKVEEDNFFNESVDLDIYSKQVEKAYNTSYKCCFCEKKYIFEEILIMHLKIHTELIHSPFKCMFCNNFECTVKTQIVSHINAHMKHRCDELRSTSFICMICNKQTYSISKLLQHVRVHTRESPFKCDICGKGFKQKGTLKMHKETHSEPTKNNLCDLCKCSFATPSSLKRHVRRIHDKGKTTRTIKCFEKNCQKTFSSVKERKIHQEAKHSYFQCEICGKSFVNKKSHRRHLSQYHGMTVNIKCIFCEATCANRERYFQHVMTDHFGFESLSVYECVRTGRFPCKFCKVPTIYKSFKSLKEHFPKHLKQHLYCDSCTSGPFNYHELNRHTILIHQEISCEICTEHFIGRRRFLTHLRYVHSKKLVEYNYLVQKKIAALKQLKCKLCLKSFTSLELVKTHLESDHNIPQDQTRYYIPKVLQKRNHVCKRCNQGFSFKKDLSKHMVTHRLKAFKCHLCERKFMTKYCLTRHVRKNSCRSTLNPVVMSNPTNTTCGNQGTSVKKDLSKNMFTHRFKVFKCQICERKFMKKTGLEAHVRRNSCRSTLNLILMSDPTNTTCGICNEPFEDLEKLSQHISLKHCGLKKNYQCPICKRKYLARGNLLRHASYEHPGMNLFDGVCTPPKAYRFYCRTCDKGFMSYNEYFRHSKRKHIGFNECRICKMKYTRPTKLTQHVIKKHPGESVYKCGTCDQGFMFQLVYLKHLKISQHDGEDKEKKFPCDICPKVIDDLLGLTEHMKQQHPNYFNKCSVCGIEFSIYREYWVHMNTVHKDNDVFRAEGKTIDSNLKEENQVLYDSETVIIQNEHEATEIEVKMFPINGLEIENCGSIKGLKTETLENSEIRDS